MNLVRRDEVEVLKKIVQKLSAENQKIVKKKPKKKKKTAGIKKRTRK